MSPETKDTRFGIPSNSEDGIVPVKEFSEHEKCVRLGMLMFPQVLGMDPENKLVSILRKIALAGNVVGKEPVNIFI